jgi:hypothetical protein
LAQGPIVNGLIDLRRLLFVVVHDETSARQAPGIRVAAYAASPTRWGARIGGAAQIRVEKNLALNPEHGGGGRRFDPAQGGLLGLALELERHLERHCHYPSLQRLKQPRWPKLWAAFDSQTARHIRPDGPEWQSTLLNSKPRRGVELAPHRFAFGLVAFPLEYVSHAWQQFAAVYADLKSVPKRQILSLDRLERSLQGFTGAVEFDLLSSRFSMGSAPRPR